MSVTLEEKEEIVPKSFKFLNHLTEHKDFLKIVKGAWKESNEDNVMKDVWNRLKKVKQAMKELNTKEYNVVGDKIADCRKQLCRMQEQMRSLGQLENMVIAEKELKMQLEKWLRVEESIMK